MEMSNKNGSGFKTLDLDELIGQAKPIKVKWQGESYEMLRSDGISPKQAVKFQKLQPRAQGLLTGDHAEVSDEEASQLEAIIDEMLAIVCVELPLENIPFGMKLKIIQFYVEETQGKNAVDAAVQRVSEPIGGASSAS